MDATMRQMGLEALERAARWLREAETCWGLAGCGGLVELIHAHRAALDGLPDLVPAGGRRELVVA